MIDEHVLALANKQLGLVSRVQLENLDISRSSIHRARAAKRIVTVLPGVSLILPAPYSFETRCLAINLWLNGVGFVSGRSAGRLQGLSRMRELPIQCTIPRSTRRANRDGIELHHTAWYDGDLDRTTLPNGVVVASPERMLFGIAADIRPKIRFGEAAELRQQRRFNDAADDAWNLGLTTPQQMAVFLEQHRCRGKDGVARIEQWLETALTRELPSQSYFERDLVNALVDVGLPEPVRQHRLELRNHHPVKIDIAWPDIRLGVEPGHSRFHAGASALERDTLRDLACAEVGWDIHRLTESARSDLAGNARRIARIHRQRTTTITLTTPWTRNCGHPSRSAG